MAPEPFPGPDARSRAVLVKNIPRLADTATIEEFFSFCGEIEDKRLSVVPPSNGGDVTLEALVVFEDHASCRTALLMTGSTILDTPVSISSVPDDYMAPDPTGSNPETNPAGPAVDDGPNAVGNSSGAPLGGIISGFGGLFADLGNTLSGEMARAGAMLDAATDTGVLKTAKDHAVLARAKTAELLQNVDAQYGVGERAGAVAGAVTTQTRNVVGAVAEQSKIVASQVDETLHVSEHAKAIQGKAMENQAVANAARSLKDGVDSLLSQTGLNQAPSSSNAGVETGGPVVENGGPPPVAS